MKFIVNANSRALWLVAAALVGLAFTAGIVCGFLTLSGLRGLVEYRALAAQSALASPAETVEEDPVDLGTRVAQAVAVPTVILQPLPTSTRVPVQRAPTLARVVPTSTSIIPSATPSLAPSPTSTLTPPLPTSTFVPTPLCTGSIVGYVRDGSAVGIPNAVLNLADSAGLALEIVTTDPSGYYEFLDLENGSYLESLTVPAGMTASSPVAVNPTVANCAIVHQDYGVIVSPTSTAVPNTPTSTPSATPTSRPTSTPTLTSSPTSTLTPTATRTASAPTPTNTPTFSGTVSSQIIAPVADAYVNQASPTTNYGTGTSLRIDGTPTTRAYMRFDVTGISGTLKQVTLRVYANSSSSTGLTLYSVHSNTWDEKTLTYSNAPALATTVTGAAGAFGAGVWVSFDVTTLINKNGTYSLALTTAGSQINLASRETGAHAPQLVVLTGP